MDEALLRAVNGWAAVPWVAGIGTALSSRWLILAVCGPLAVHFVRRRRWAAIVSVTLAMAAGDAIVARILKPAFGRERPCRALEGLVPAARCGVGRSFPSGHATVSFAFLTSAAPLVPYGWVVFAPLATGVAGSRVLLGVHYPTDVTAGAALGSVIGLVAGRLRRRAERRDDDAAEEG